MLELEIIEIRIVEVEVEGVTTNVRVSDRIVEVEGEWYTPPYISRNRE